MANFKKFFEDTGRKIIGQGLEVEFKNKIDDRMKKAGLTKEQAEKSIFADYISRVKAEIAANGTLNYNSREFKSFKAALNKIFGATDVEKFKKDSEDVAIFKPIAIPPSTTAELKNMREHYKESFKKYNKDINLENALKTLTPTIDDSVQDTKIIEQLLSRCAMDMSGSIGIDLPAFLATNPEIGADLGKIISAKELLEKHERKLGAIFRFEKVKKETINNFTDFTWKNPTEWFGEVIKSTVTLKPNIGKVFGACFKTAVKETWTGVKLMGKTVELLDAYINKQINK